MMADKKFFEIFDKNIQGKFSYLPSHIKHMEVKVSNNMLIIDSGFPSNMFNIICCHGKIDRPSIQEAIDHFRLKLLPYAFWVGFESDPSWLEEELLASGLITDEMEWAMICDLSSYKPELISPNFNIKQVNNRRGVQEIINVMNGILPKEEHQAIKSFYEQSTDILLSPGCPSTFFIGYMNDKAISMSSSYCQEGLASIFDVIVLPEARGKGLGKGMTLQAMVDAQIKGFNQCILTATNNAKYLYQKLGFRDLKTMKVYHQP